MKNKVMKFIDLFCGIGGFRIGAEQVFAELGSKGKCVFSSDIDPYSRKAYFENFGEVPAGDITKINEHDIPDHDILFAGFPCQPFSIIGNGKGFRDIRGTLFFDIARILYAKKPKAFILENVKRLVTHSDGKTLKKILDTLDELGYYTDYKVLNALDYGLPQKRERVFIVGHEKPFAFPWPQKLEDYASLKEILEKNVKSKYYASEAIRKSRQKNHKSKHNPSIWHENKSGNVSSYPYSCALRAGASYNYLLVNGKRRLTPRELLRLQGFPDSFKIVLPDLHVRKQAGNAVPVSVVKHVFRSMMHVLNEDVVVLNIDSINERKTAIM